MRKNFIQFGVLVGALACAWGAAVVFFPHYLTDTDLLALLILLEIFLVAMWHYRSGAFVMLAIVFFFAGTGVPPSGFWHAVRWFVLAAAAFIGAVKYLGDHRLSFKLFHVVALSCALAAAVSASVSSYPQDSLFKAFSFFLLLLFASSGMRISVAGQELAFVFRMVLFCEILTYITAFCYLALNYKLFGNPNSLGATMGSLVVPLMLWAVFATKGTPARRRYLLTLALSVLLLIMSFARAGMLAGAVSSFLVCVALRRYRALAVLTGMVLVTAGIVLSIFPPQTGDRAQSLTSAFVYKGHREEGLLGSRRSPWQQTMSSVSEHPWFGTGFGTSATQVEESDSRQSFKSSAHITREHGSSYLAILEWVGSLGVLPFAALLLLILNNVRKSVAIVYRTGDVLSPLLPIAAIALAGLVDAGFEDWLFATGYYLCVMFWAMAFVLVDILPAAQPHIAALTNWQPALATQPVT